MLDDRAEKVLKAVVESHIASSEPVSAGAISKLNDFNLCPASIRNVMAELEESGFLSQPHTSAGRVPSDLGYHYYAQSLIDPPALPPDQALDIHLATHSSEWLELADLMESVSKTLSNLSKQASLVGLTSPGAAPIKKIQFVHISGRLVLAVMVMPSGEIRRYVIATQEDVTQDSLDRMTNYFNDRFTYLSLAQIRRLLLKELQLEQNRLNRMITWAFAVTEALERQADLDDSERIYLEGANNLIRLTEDNADLAKIRALFETLNEKGKLLSLLEECIQSEGINLTIGAESEIDGFDDYTVVTHAFSGFDGMTGAVGIIGQKRMDYGHSMALVACAALSVSRRLTGYCKKGLN